ncbi:hypothetical protein V491_03227 [Pseudogymnoascus sp. VKM F-3775]|nr:hypothetical protein V491_03227 [Pseudogymnoascus sp. VKM F-3775]
MAPSLIASYSSAEDGQEASNGGDITLDSAPVIPDPVFIDIGGNCLDWNDPQDDFSDFVDLQSNVGTVQYPTEIESSPAQHWIPSTNQTSHIQQDVFSPYISVPKQPTTTFRSLIRRPKLSTGAQRTANLILYTLKSYPLMMLDNGSLPPFIHPHLIFSEAENNDMELLINCICLVRMISNGIQKSRKLFWKNVRMECEQICEESAKLNKWELLAGLQALSIYILIRLDEGETEQNNLDSLLLAAVTILSKRFGHSDITREMRQSFDKITSKISWDDWLFEESRRRSGFYPLRSKRRKV